MRNEDYGRRLIALMRLFHFIYRACNKEPKFFDAVFVISCTFDAVARAGWKRLGTQPDQGWLEQQAKRAWGFENGVPIRRSTFTAMVDDEEQTDAG